MWITTNYRILSPPLTSSVTLSKWTSCSTPQLLIWETELTTADDSYNVRMMWRMYTLGSAKSLTHDTLFLECKTPWVKIASLFYGFLIKRKQCLLSYLIMTSLFVWCTPISETLKYLKLCGIWDLFQNSLNGKKKNKIVSMGVKMKISNVLIIDEIGWWSVWIHHTIHYNVCVWKFLQ